MMRPVSKMTFLLNSLTSGVKEEQVSLCGVFWLL